MSACSLNGSFRGREKAAQLDGRVLHLIKMWLECAVEDTEA
jgi:hypothetical protein